MEGRTGCSKRIVKLKTAWYIVPDRFTMAGILGFEPRLTVLETVALPLNYTPKSLRSLKLATLSILSSMLIDVNNL